ncbi:Acyl-CoA dehydrogenase [Roseateles sp. YR242]|uniref:acyl-CoA dehydrogenase family protein n=1 Tax=Roseateles sp. YR242 TaxID=1855305 RepID=UPI0008D4BE6A|nr:acyl-CoA dehydrogenase family protein [Roseateles sp. YR242]SEL39297.1 Acyl-CoA dehydrogenase [Roseateles sp. YR242]
MNALPHRIRPAADAPTVADAWPLQDGQTADVRTELSLLARLTPLLPALAARAPALDRDGSFPFENLADLHAAGLLGAVVPATAGGGGASLATTRRLIGALGQAEPATALVVAMSYLVHHLLSRETSRWPPAVRDEVWRTAVVDGALANSLRVEPALGSPARGGLPGTVARRTEDGWRLNGHKLYTTGIPALRWLVVYARSEEPGREDRPRVGVFLVPREAPGIRVIESWDHLGLRASGSHEVVFEDVPLPLSHAVDLREPAEWAAGPEPDQYAWMSTLLGALYDGVARAARAWLLGFLNERAPGSLGAPLATLPRVQHLVGEIEVLLASNDALLDRLVRDTDAGRTPSVNDSSIVKHLVSKQAIQVVELALQLSGNHGLSRRNPLERHHRDVLCSRIHTPQDDSVLGAAGRAALQAAPSPPTSLPPTAVSPASPASPASPLARSPQHG